MKSPRILALIGLFAILAVPPMPAADLPDPDALRTKASEQSKRLNKYRELMADPDPNIRISAFKALIETNDPALRKIAFDAALTSADPVLRNIGLKYKLFSMNKLMFNWRDGGRTTSAGMRDHDYATGNFQVRASRTYSARVIGDRVEFDGVWNCSGALEFDGDRRVTGTLKCDEEQVPAYIVIR